MSKFKNMKDSQMLRVRVPKALYESIQAELHKKEEMKETHEMDETHDTMEENVLTDPNFIGGLSALLGVGGALAAAIVRDLKRAKTPEEKKQILGKAAQGIGRTMSGDQGMNEGVLTDPNFIGGLAALLGVGGALAAAIVRDLKRAKSPEEKKQILAKAAQGVGKTMSGGL